MHNNSVPLRLSQQHLSKDQRLRQMPQATRTDEVSPDGLAHSSSALGPGARHYNASANKIMGKACPNSYALNTAH